MAKDPAILFYTSDFLTGTSFFTAEQRGQYIQLLCEQHQLWSIPENHMIFVCGSLESPVIKKFKKDTDGNYYNERMREEAIKRSNYCDSRGNNKKGRIKNKIISKSYDNHMENENRIINERLKKEKELFEIFRLKYPGTKRGLDSEFNDLVKKHKNYKEICLILLTELERQINERSRITGFVPEWPHLKTYLHNNGWETEYKSGIKESNYSKNRKLKLPEYNENN